MALHLAWILHKISDEISMNFTRASLIYAVIIEIVFWGALETATFSSIAANHAAAALSLKIQFLARHGTNQLGIHPRN
jgi:hypothetical protein